MDVRKMDENSVRKDCEKRILDYVNSVASDLLDNVKEIQRGVIYDHQKRAYVDTKGNPVRDMFGQPVEDTKN